MSSPPAQTVSPGDMQPYWHRLDWGEDRAQRNRDVARHRQKENRHDVLYSRKGDCPVGHVDGTINR